MFWLESLRKKPAVIISRVHYLRMYSGPLLATSSLAWSRGLGKTASLARRSPDSDRLFTTDHTTNVFTVPTTQANVLLPHHLILTMANVLSSNGNVLGQTCLPRRSHQSMPSPASNPQDAALSNGLGPRGSGHLYVFDRWNQRRNE